MADGMELSRSLSPAPQGRIPRVWANGASSSAPVEVCSEHPSQTCLCQCRVSELSLECSLHISAHKPSSRRLLYLGLSPSRRESRCLSRKHLIECFIKIGSKCFPLDKSKGDHMYNSLSCQNIQFFDLVGILWCRRRVFQYLVCLLNTRYL